ncbi:MAG: hypothetical protein JWQ20_3226 [Conexibacter sp.]|nr:hypothetical protein [Conexibacter sp.]
MDTTPVDLRTAAAIEAGEARAWADLYTAAPAQFAQAAGLGVDHIDGSLVLRWTATGRRYFSRVIGLGVAKPATAQVIGSILDRYRRAGIAMFLLQSLPHCRPAGYERLLRERGLRPFDAQDRILRGNAPIAPLGARAGHRDLIVERVGPRSADAWADFLQRVYRLETGPWLQALIDRTGWHQYVAREGGEIVAARGMYLGPGGIAWLGMDGPVPGIATDDYEPDAAICATAVADGLAHGAKAFIADIEQPSPRLDTPPYANFAALGFGRPYARTHWTS